MPNVLVQNLEVLAPFQQVRMLGKEEAHQCVDGEREDERLPCLPYTRPHVVTHGIAFARARRADSLG
eukprot:2467511-Prymnesium_polylepis.1